MGLRDCKQHLFYFPSTQSEIKDQMYDYVQIGSKWRELPIKFRKYPKDKWAWNKWLCNSGCLFAHLIEEEPHEIKEN
jgi:hypothetical protein